MNCLFCSADVTNGLALCALCQRKASADLDYLPVYFRNLARWRPGRAGSRPVPGSRVLYDGGRPRGDRIAQALDETGADLVGWAEALDDDRPGVVRWPLDLAELDEAQQAIRLCEIFAEYLATIATLEWGGAFVGAVGQHETTMRELTEASVPGWYAGACGRKVTMEATCGAATFVVPGLTWVTCGSCGATTYARDHLETILDEARGWVARPMRLAEAVVALVDTELSIPRLHKRISKWGEREQIEAIRPHDYAPKRYRFGEVLDRLLSEGATRLDEMSTEAS